MKKILFLVNHDVVIYNFRAELVERLISDGHDVYISCPYGDRIEDLKAIGCKYIDTDISRHGTNPFKDFKLLRFYKKTIKAIKPDMVFSYTIKPNIYGGLVCKKLKVPYVANITGLGTAVENKGILQIITTHLYKKALKKAQRVFFQNTQNMQFFVDKKIALGKHALLPGSGVNLQKFSLLPYPETDKVEFVFISRIMKEKGIDQYLDAAECFHSKNANVKFHICGFCEEEYEERLAKLSEQGVIVYHGIVKDVREILKDVHCTVHPTYYPEGLSNVLLESCASGRPIITTDRAGCREVIEDGVNGFIVNQKDSKDLIAKIEKFLSLSNEDRRRMGLAGREKVEKEFDRQIVVEKYVEELKKV